MLYQILDVIKKAIVDRNLTYEEATAWIDCDIERRYVIQPMKED